MAKSAVYDCLVNSAAVLMDVERTSKAHQALCLSARQFEKIDGAPCYFALWLLTLYIYTSSRLCFQCKIRVKMTVDFVKRCTD